jgi:hypothetical protein
MTSMFQNSPSLKFFFLLAAILYSGQSNFEFEYLGEFLTEFEIFQVMNQGPRCVRLMEESGGRKSRATVPLNPTFARIVCLILANVSDYIYIFIFF